MDIWYTLTDVCVTAIYLLYLGVLAGATVATFRRGRLADLSRIQQQ